MIPVCRVDRAGASPQMFESTQQLANIHPLRNQGKVRFFKETYILKIVEEYFQPLFRIIM